MTLALQGLNIVVTRPAHQAESFCQLIEAYGAQAQRFPLLTIEVVERAPDTLQSLTHSDKPYYDWVIFISANAVEYGLALLPDAHCLPPYTLGAIGKQTAQRLQAYGLSVTVQPEQAFSSEALLSLAATQADNIQHKRILIVRGQGGRELLAQTLRQRGAVVDYADVYRRCSSNTSADLLKQLHANARLDIICLTSSAGLMHLLDLLPVPASRAPDLRNVPLLLGSPRIAAAALAAGLSNTVTAANPSDKAMLEALLHWRRTSNNHDRQA